MSRTGSGGVCVSLAGIALVLIQSGCVAPIARTSVIREGWDFELAAGPTVFRSVSIFDDSGDQLPRIEPWRVVGGVACVRGNYGFSPEFGLEGTVGMSYGEPVPRTSGTFQGWPVIDVAARSRPFSTNHAFTLEYRATEGELSLLWTGGYPTRGREKLALTVGVGTGQYTITDGLGHPAALVQMALCYNVYTRGQRISPMVSGAGLVSVGGDLRQGMSAMAGVVWAPTRR